VPRRRTSSILVLAAIITGFVVWQGPWPAEINLESPLLLGTMNRQTSGNRSWQTTGGQPTDPTRIDVTTTPRGSYRLVLDLPGYWLESIMIAGRPCSHLDVPGLVKLKTTDLPELPVVSTTLPIPTAAEVHFRITAQTVRAIPIEPVEPSRGHLDRNCDPATVAAHFGALYEAGGVWPDKPVVMSETFLLRSQQGVNLRVNPLRYDAGRGLLLVTEHMVVEVVVSGGNGKNLTDPTTGFSPVGEALFGASLPTATDKYEALAPHGRMLIIAPNDLATAVIPLVHWKRRRGIPTELVTLPYGGATSDDIATIITTAYHEPAGLTWVILVGDRAQIPPAVGHYDGSDSDTRYTMVSGDDIYPDLFISRISADTPIQVATQVNKFIAYEKTPDTGGNTVWYNRATGIASDEGTPSDAERADRLRTTLIEYGYNPVDQIYQNRGGTTSLISEVLNGGVSFINYLGHGSGYSWQSVPFGQGDIAALDHTNRLPWIVDVSCSNGDIALDDCFAEAWLNAGTPIEPSGAVGMIAASSLSPWTPPTVMQSEVVDRLTTGRAFTLGALYFSGLMRVADLYAGLPVAERVLEQNIIFGDCSLQVRTTRPSAFTVVCPTSLPPDATSMELEISGPEGSTVALTRAGVLLTAATTGSSPFVELPLDTRATEMTTVDVTVTGFNMVPWTASVALPAANRASAADSPATPARVTLLGNFPNPFNPGTRIAFALPADAPVQLRVYNIRGQLVRDLSRDTLPAGPHEIFWDGRDRNGSPAPSGVYLYRLEVANQRLTGQMTLSK